MVVPKESTAKEKWPLILLIIGSLGLTIDWYWRTRETLFSVIPLFFVIVAIVALVLAIKRRS